MATTKRDQLAAQRQQSSKKAIPNWVRVVLNLFYVMPTILLFLYVTGLWGVEVDNNRLVRDDLDNIVLSFCLFAGVGGVILLNVLLNAYTEEE